MAPVLLRWLHWPIFVILPPPAPAAVNVCPPAGRHAARSSAQPTAGVDRRVRLYRVGCGGSFVGLTGGIHSEARRGCQEWGTIVVPMTSAISRQSAGCAAPWEKNRLETGHRVVHGRSE